MRLLTDAGPQDKARKHDTLPTTDRSPGWHFDRFVDFTRFKGEVGEPSPHLAVAGWLMAPLSLTERKLWLLGLYAATYCLPTAQVLWALKTPEQALDRDGMQDWLTAKWPGIVTRTERRCVRTPRQMAECLESYARWMADDFPALTQLRGETPENYDKVWKSVDKIKYFGRYINIRFVEGLRRYFRIPARLYDIRSIGGWSPKRALCYLYPQHVKALLTDTPAGNTLTDQLAHDLLDRVKAILPKVDPYVLAAMTCEYKAAYENNKQYPGWTIDQEPLLYDKVFNYWGDVIDKELLWAARKALFPPQVLGELNGWNGTRWPLTTTLRTHGYVWSDLRYNYKASVGDLSRPVAW